MIGLGLHAVRQSLRRGGPVRDKKRPPPRATPTSAAGKCVAANALGETRKVPRQGRDNQRGQTFELAAQGAKHVKT